MGKYNEQQVVRELSKNPAIVINGNKINIVKDNTLVGSGTWGKIDFLTKYCGYTFEIIDVDEQRAAKIAEKEAKFQAKREAQFEKTKIKLIDKSRSSGIRDIIRNAKLIKK